VSVARILVCEPHKEVRELLGHVVARLGHEPVLAPGGPHEAFDTHDVDVLLIEPADPRALETAQILRLERERIPIICTSIYPPTPSSASLDLVAYLVKPFALHELEHALEEAVASLGVAA
jgi:CheY-like chemotaxis protein